MHTKQTYQKTFLLCKENANSKAVQKMDTHQTESSLKENSFHMVATSSTLVMHRTLWMAPTFCTATMAFGTLAFPHVRVCTHSVLTRSWPLNYYYHLEEVSGLLMHFNRARLFSFVYCTEKHMFAKHVTQTRLGHTFKCNKLKFLQYFMK